MTYCTVGLLVSHHVRFRTLIKEVGHLWHISAPCIKLFFSGLCQHVG
jgi:hypothetical protein